MEHAGRVVGRTAQSQTRTPGLGAAVRHIASGGGARISGVLRIGEDVVEVVDNAVGVDLVDERRPEQTAVAEPGVVVA